MDAFLGVFIIFSSTLLPPSPPLPRKSWPPLSPTQKKNSQFLSHALTSKNFVLPNWYFSPSSSSSSQDTKIWKKSSVVSTFRSRIANLYPWKKERKKNLTNGYLPWKFDVKFVADSVKIVKILTFSRPFYGFFFLFHVGNRLLEEKFMLWWRSLPSFLPF